MFPCEIWEILKNIFFTEHLWWLLLEGVCEEASLVKIVQSSHFNIFGISHTCFFRKKMPILGKINNRDCCNVYRFSCFIFTLFSDTTALATIVIQPFYVGKERFQNFLLFFYVKIGFKLILRIASKFQRHSKLGKVCIAFQFFLTNIKL